MCITWMEFSKIIKLHSLDLCCYSIGGNQNVTFRNIQLSNREILLPGSLSRVYANENAAISLETEAESRSCMWYWFKLYECALLANSQGFPLEINRSLSVFTYYLFICYIYLFVVNDLSIILSDCKLFLLGTYSNGIMEGYGSPRFSCYELVGFV